MNTCDGRKVWKNCFAQLVWLTGSRVQDAILKGVKSDGKLEGMQFSRVDMEHCLNQSWILDRRLVQYANCLHAKAQGTIHHSICVDKSDVCGLGAGLMNGVVVFRDNVAAELIPQVGALPIWVRSGCVDLVI